MSPDVLFRRPLFIQKDCGVIKMKLPESLVSDFAKLVSGNNARNRNQSTFVYGTAQVDEQDNVSVIFDGADTPTPVSTTVGVKTGDRVMVLIRNHAATIMSNITSPVATFEAITAKYADLGGFISVAGDKDCWTKTSVNGGHRYPTSLYKHGDDGTYEYEVGMKGDGKPGNLAFYIKRITKGDVWHVENGGSETDMFYIKHNGELFARNADITGKITATSGSFKGDIVATSFRGTYKLGNAITMEAILSGAGLDLDFVNTDAKTRGHLWLNPNNTIWAKEKLASQITNNVSITYNKIRLGTSDSTYNLELSVDGSIFSGGGVNYTHIHSNSVDVHATDGGDIERTGRFTTSAAGNIGLYDVDKSAWIIRSGPDYNVYIPHPTSLTSVETYSGFQKPVGSYGTDGRRVAFVSARVDGSNYQFRVSGQWGATGNNYSVKTIWSASTSDIRLKENIKPTDVVGLKAVNKMLVRQFDWKRDGRHQDIGFVADELEKIDPNLALGGGYDEDGNMDEKQVNTYQVVAYLVKAVQELSAQVHELKGDDDGR